MCVDGALSIVYLLGTINVLLGLEIAGKTGHSTTVVWFNVAQRWIAMKWY